MAQTHYFRGVETTTVRDRDGALVGFYRGTPVAQQLGNIVTLKTGGWKSNTTKTRMNQFANNFVGSKFAVFQKSYQWFVLNRSTNETLPFDGDTITFEVQ